MSPKRQSFANTTVHIRHRANKHLDVFLDDDDCEWYLELWRRASRNHRLAVHNYALMKTHSHILATPQTETALPGAMRDIGQRYSSFFNQKYLRSGTLWHGPYEAKAVDDEPYMLLCMRYVEQNPVRAQIVRSPEEYRWSSYRVHGLGEASDWIAAHPVYTALGATPAERQAVYRGLCLEPLTPYDMLWLSDGRRFARRSRLKTKVA